MDSSVNSNGYRGLVDQAYIQPIKTVLVIDDQYKSLDCFLDGLTQDLVFSANAELTRQIDTLKMVRSNNWLADMHDGQISNNDPALFMRLHQCDLLILDYHLDATNQADPTKALEILSALNQNHHFNLVVVYTAAEDLKKVRTEMFLQLASTEFDIFLDDASNIEKMVQNWSDEGDDYLDELLSKITKSEIETVLTHKGVLDGLTEFTALFSPLQMVLDSGEIELSTEEAKELYLFLLKEKVRVLHEEGEFSGASSVEVSCDLEDPIWLKTDKLFVTVVSKEQVQPKQLPETLINALENWSPTCHQLLLAKIKNELDDHGQAFENDVLNCKYTSTGWLKEFSENEGGSQLTITRLMEELSNSINNSSELNCFSKNINTYIEGKGLSSVIAKETCNEVRLDIAADKIKVLKHLNAYINTQNIEGNHLMTGHVIKWYDSNPEKTQYLLCLTPACELVPGRANSNNNKGWKSDLAPLLPVKVIRLIKQENDKKSLKDITKKPIVVLNIDKTTMCFKAADDGKSVFDEQIFANYQGKFKDLEGSKKVEIQRTILNEQVLSIDTRECRIVAHLRYEYALNLLQRLGQDLTKIGLDYVAFR